VGDVLERLHLPLPAARLFAGPEGELRPTLQQCVSRCEERARSAEIEVEPCSGTSQPQTWPPVTARLCMTLWRAESVLLCSQSDCSFASNVCLSNWQMSFERKTWVQRPGISSGNAQTGGADIRTLSP